MQTSFIKVMGYFTSDSIARQALVTIAPEYSMTDIDKTINTFRRRYHRAHSEVIDLPESGMRVLPRSQLSHWQLACATLQSDISVWLNTFNALPDGGYWARQCASMHVNWTSLNDTIGSTVTHEIDKVLHRQAILLLAQGCMQFAEQTDPTPSIELRASFTALNVDKPDDFLEEVFVKQTLSEQLVWIAQHAGG